MMSEELKTCKKEDLEDVQNPGDWTRICLAPKRATIALNCPFCGTLSFTSHRIVPELLFDKLTLTLPVTCSRCGKTFEVKDGSVIERDKIS